MNEITSFNKLAVELDNGRWLTELQMDNCDLLWSLFCLLGASGSPCD